MGILDEKKSEFKDEKGNPANEHAKKLSLKKAQQERAAQNFEEYYTDLDGKILHCKVKANGTYRTFYAKKKSLTKEAYKELVAKWKKDDLWIAEDMVEQKTEELRKKVLAKLKK